MEGEINISVQTVTSSASPQWIMITAGTKSMPIRRGNRMGLRREQVGTRRKGLRSEMCSKNSVCCHMLQH